MASILAIGSLMSPFEVVRRGSAEMQSAVDEFCEYNGYADDDFWTYRRDFYRTPEADESLKETLPNRVQMVPGMLSGFERYYDAFYVENTEISRAGVSARESDGAEISSVLITGLTEDEKGAIASEEGPYRPVSVGTDRFKPDTPSAITGPVEGIEITVYTHNTGHPAFYSEPQAPRIDVYHDVIMQGLEYVAQQYERISADELQDRFENTTHEAREGEWTIISK